MISSLPEKLAIANSLYVNHPAAVPPPGNKKRGRSLCNIFS